MHARGKVKRREKRLIFLFPVGRETRTVKNRQAFESVSVAVCVDCDESGVNERGRPLTFTAHAHTHTSQESEAEEGGEISLNDYPTPGMRVQD
ncbi:hypothetical protein QQF64_024587 [Cirrhinus molitorella]|uniref:Uncharacterized protein n=1 Tax=Cirrhinus molitorella TaxID=172907 RepID=A0ABR3NMK5_9TELE